MNYDKPALSVEDQIALHEIRGMIISDHDRARNFLSSISYYRLSGYWFTFLQIPRSNHVFYPNTTFEKVLDTYIFDRKLRVLIFDQIEKIEVALRTSIALHYSNAFGAYWFLDPDHYDNSGRKNPSSLRDKFCQVLSREYENSKEEFINQFKRKYTGPRHLLTLNPNNNPLPPCWMAVEILTITQLSVLYSNLRRGGASTPYSKVASDFGVDPQVLTSWLHSISFVRNVCAHHGRLWNRKNPSSPMQPRSTRWLVNQIPQQDLNLFFTTATIIKCLLDRIAGNNSLYTNLLKLFGEFPDVPKEYMGFHPGWHNDPLWTNKLSRY